MKAHFLASLPYLGRSAAGRQLVGALCYDPCPSDYAMVLGKCGICELERGLGGSVEFGACPRACSGRHLEPAAACACLTGMPATLPTPLCKGTCWRNCPSGYTDIGAMCTREGYPDCRAGFTGVGPVCWGSCASDCTDVGATCYCRGDTRGKSCCKKWGVCWSKCCGSW